MGDAFAVFIITYTRYAGFERHGPAAATELARKAVGSEKGKRDRRDTNAITKRARATHG